MKVLKRNGKVEKLSAEKFNNLASWACLDLKANPSDLIMNAQLSLYNGIKTSKIHELLIDSAMNMINIKQTDYQYVAGRLLALYMRKQIFGVTFDKDMPHLIDVIIKNVKLTYYTEELLTKFNEVELNQLNDALMHENDMQMTFAQLKKISDSYAVRNRKTGYIYETPQYIFMCMSMMIYDKVDDVIAHYKELVNKTISYPTPIIAGLRTSSKQFASCTLIEIADTIDSIGASNHAMVRFVSKRAGLGVGYYNLRSLGSSIRNGEVEHTGLIPFLRATQNAIKSCSQGGIREGSATVTLQIWNPEIEELLVLKNNKGTDDNRVKFLDYSIQNTGYFLKRILKGQDISLFSTIDAPKLMETFGLPEFDEIYESYEADESVPRKIINGRELMNLFIDERQGTGRMYMMFIDNVNNKNQFIDRITMSNLCQEIVEPTEPFNSIDSGEGEIALCNLGGINLGVIDGPDTFWKLEQPIAHLVYALNKIVDIQDYPVIHAEKQLLRRNLGIGVTNFAYWLAKNKKLYTDETALPLIDELFEHIQFYLIKASMNLAKESGEAEWFYKTKYASAIFPHDQAKETVLKLVDRKLTCDWETLRKDVLKYGMKNSVLSALMPVESSSLVTNSTNGIEPPRSFVVTKTNKTSVSNKIVVPEAKELAEYYTLAWDNENINFHINQITAVIQKWIDQAISVNHYYNPNNYEGFKTPRKKVLRDIIQFYNLGGKNLYYSNTLDSIEDKNEQDCEACKL
jgi:ribonucleoside-diphosphate reductase alpha chain